jgi:LPXTG-site transpeptidase (sortase) family protein
MVRNWPAPAWLARVPSHALGEVVLLVLVIGAMLAFASSDGTQGSEAVAPITPTVAFVQAPLMDFRWLAGSISGMAGINLPVPEPPMPSAAPATILIPSINVHRPVEPVGVDRSGMMYQPTNLWNAGWYKGGPVPGAPGDAVIEGHAGYPDAPLLFGRLTKLKNGDRIIVVLADQTQQVFLVQSLSVWRAGTSPAGLGEPYGPPRLTLITCTGPFDDQYKTYADRLVVEATYAGQA